MLQTMRERGVSIVDVHQAPEDAYAEHCRDADVATAPLRDCLTYYNGEGNAAPGSLAYYGGGRWHKWRITAQASLAPLRSAQVGRTWRRERECHSGELSMVAGSIQKKTMTKNDDR